MIVPNFKFPVDQPLLKELRVSLEKTHLFRNIFYSVWAILAVYLVVFSLFEAKLAVVSMSLGLFIFSPLTLWMDKNNRSTQAKLLFIFCCNFYIYTSSLSLRHSISSEYYYLPATMLPLLIFDLSQRNSVIFGISLPFGMWLLTKTLGFNYVKPEFLASTNFNEVIAFINFIGSFSLILIFLNLFMRAIFSLQALLLKSEVDKRTELIKLNECLSKETFSLAESQKIAKIGNWDFDIVTGKITFSDQLFLILPHKKSDGEPTFDEHRATIHPADLPIWERSVTRCMQDGTPYLLIFRVQNTEGGLDENGKKYKWVEGRGQATMNAEGKILTLFGTCQDIHESRCLQIQLNQERAMASHNEKLANLGEMSAGVAHEINNPLAIIKGNFDILRKNMNLDEKTEKRFLVIEKSVERISKIVGGLRKFSRTTDRKELNPCDINLIMAEVANFVRLKADRHEVAISIALNSKGLFVADEVEVEQVLVNIINNGIDAIKDRAEKWIKITSREEDSKIIIQITDSGNGIKKEFRDSIFNPFFTTKKVGEGTGLGLSIAKGIVQSYAGTLELVLDSTNTCFEIQFPKCEQKERVSIAT